MYFTVSALYLEGKQYFAGIAIDIAERKKKEDEIYYLSYHDQLTGLYNRRFYEEELKRLDGSRNPPMTIVMGDVNGLKLINDSFGHVMGDELLIKVLDVIKAYYYYYYYYYEVRKGGVKGDFKEIKDRSEDVFGVWHDHNFNARNNWIFIY